MQTITTIGEAIAILVRSVQAGFNVLLEGPHGGGKTSIVQAAAAQLNLTMKYFSASTLDPYTDLVGVPVPITNGDLTELRFVRNQSIHTAHIIFLDEFNRAHPKTTNATFEMVQFRTINGEPLPNLWSVIAAVNPSEAGYQVTDLDPALLDRFHVHLRVESGPDKKWYAQHLGERVAGALVDWYYADLNDKERKQISLRRLEYIGLCYKSDIDLACALPSTSTTAALPLPLLEARLAEKETTLDIEDFVADPARFSAEVARNVEVADRFASLLHRMSPKQKCMVKVILLSLPREILAKIKNESPKAFKAVKKALDAQEGKAEADAFMALIEEQLSSSQL